MSQRQLIIDTIGQHSQQHQSSNGDLITSDNLKELTKTQSNTYSHATIYSNTTFSPAYLSALLNTLQSDATIEAHVPASVGLDSALTYAGFTQLQTQQNGESVKITAKKPSWQAGSAAKLNFKKKATSTNVNDEEKRGESSQQSQPQSSVINAWKLAASAEDDDMNGNNEYEDEDQLLEREAVKPIIGTKAVASDCGPEAVGKRKACKNCTCGLAEAESKVTIDDLNEGDVLPVTSQCGSCGLGDAFRCAGCPFLGKPAFKTDSSNRVKLQL